MPQHPKTLGACADRLLRLRDERLALQKKVDKMREDERELADHTLGLMNQQRTEKASGKHASVSKTRTVKPVVQDWDALYDHIAKERAFDLLQRRPAVGAFRERFDAGASVPGVDAETFVDLTLRKR